MAEGEEIGEENRAWSAADAASLAGAAARAADLAEEVAHVGTAVACEFTLAAVCDVVLDEAVRTLGARFATLHPRSQIANPGGGHTTANAWASFPTLRWLLLVTAALGLLLGYLQAARPAPALPVTLDVVLVTLAAITTLVLLIRLLTGDGSPQVGGWLGLVATAALTVGAFASLREEEGWDPKPPHP